MFSLESPHRGYFNEYTQHTIIIKIILNYPNLQQCLQLWEFSWGLKNEFEIAVVKESPVSETLKFCILLGVQ